MNFSLLEQSLSIFLFGVYSFCTSQSISDQTQLYYFNIGELYLKVMMEKKSTAKLAVTLRLFSE